ncbi:ABC transporter permease [Glaciihabitans arcticus]|uniref:ABC transporter permease n=1 Tax=Glaciihabitans arcticus TaxID=2668039 RepID=A0A4Q9GWC5_9MICO|nr:ABC transporter permease [Glaciihabitans arcticus]TBN58604.1 ABC transporter permease [Glaciihabitans arcticus]
MFRRAIRRPLGLVSVSVLGAVLLLAVLGPLLAPFDPLVGDARAILAGPSAEHWLGTDPLGRDVLSRLLAGSTLSLVSAAEAVALGLLLGVIPGLLSVYLGRAFEWITLRLMDSLITLPFLVFAIALTALLGNGLHQAMFAVGILVAPGFYRVSRAAALAVVSSPYVEAARLVGASPLWVLRTHLWSKVAPTVAVTTANMMGAGLVIVSALTFLGIGVQPPEPTWGGMLATDLGYLYQRPYGPFIPAALIMLTVGAFNGLADALQDSSRDSRTVVSSTVARIRKVAHV